ncbi:MAG: serine/threonine protein kinase [Calditrichaceae bacterium]|nr:serine/threonine protein kinase [Calditrichaceae bacterium]MBN2708025.1 serine/threonine protein kinase [Calditrichaceae bacterium]RQV93966.1 MAG: serine/threonine protein kinase [Calditrichota bacterium]
MDNSESSSLFLDKFHLIDCLKKDSNTAVYIARHIYLDKKIFLKTVDSENLSNPDLLNRFEREAKTLAHLDHPNIIKILDFGIWKSIYYISFEYFESQNLRQIFSDKEYSHQQKIMIIRQIVSGLNTAHNHNIVHRDIKPENILINEQLQVKIADFGLALFKDSDNQTKPSSIVGTPAYMSPEQIRGEKLTRATDLFSLGIIVYELYLRQNPFLGNDVGQTLNSILNVNIKNNESPLKTLPDEINKIVCALLQKNTEERLRSADKLLQPYLDDKIQDASARQHFRNLKSGIIFIASIVVILFIAISIYFIFHPFAAKESIVNQTPQNVPEPPPASEMFRNNEQRTIIPSAENLRVSAKQKDKPADIKEYSNNQVVNNEKSMWLPAQLTIECRPWAYVYLDSVLIDSTPLSGAVELNSGNHLLIFKHPEYPDYVLPVYVKPGEKKIISIDLANTVGYLNCKIFPWGEIFIDESPAGQSPLEKPIRLSPGTYKMTLKNSGYLPYSQTINIDKGDTLDIEYYFTEKITDTDE